MATSTDWAVGIQGTVTQQTDAQSSDVFQGFGASLLAPSALRPSHHLSLPRELATGRQQVREQIPVCPGIYGWLNRDKTLIYVGKSKSLRHRLLSYFATETTDPKMAKIRRHSRTLVWEPISHELLALIREQELITRFRPSYNVQGKPERRQPGFICLSQGVAPTIFFAREVPKRAAHAFGPIAGRARLTEVIECLNYVFQLRNCPDRVKMQFNNQLELFPDERTAQCLRFELNTCPGPCAGRCSREAYRQKVEKAVRFLRGKDNSMLDRLDERMRQAAAQLSFERAGVLRDQARQIKWLSRRIQQMSRATKKLDGVWSLPEFDHQEHWMILRAGQIVECTQGRSDARSLPACLDAQARQAQVPQTHLNINLMMLLAAWIKKNPRETKAIVKLKEIVGSTASRASQRSA